MGYARSMKVEQAPVYSLPTSDAGTPSVAEWLKEMREMRREARDERKEQTKAFVDALSDLGTKLDNNTNVVRDEMKRHLNVLSLVFIGSFVVLAALAGATVYFKFGPIQSGTGQAPEAHEAAPAAADVP